MFRTGFRSDDFSAARLGALGLAAVLVLGGCSGSGDDPGAEAAEGSNSAAPSGSAAATESPSASPTPTPTPTAAAYKPASAEGPAENVPLPVMPDLAKQESKEGLEAFAEYWYALVNYGYETGDPEPVRAVSADTCFNCLSYYRVLDSGYAESDWMMGAKLHLQDVSSNYVETDEGAFQATTLILQDDLHYYGPAGYIGTDPGNSTPAVQLMEAVFTSSGWYVVTLETLEM
ncbi:DUF6318 family protein [Arthrobacter sp. zg-Y1219]|uniref:DUF6318 family protein n=1 Tax=Arthrobacter sp. zg-Y1219 TaxID=3049067 RepID=UPI0024C33A72|nr:DUF6318 family protein [Arthrobacter sp. zg-Y1219]MDK1361177.1 DUF6318 family protein [Arthrobacter sp. zg-Y1219]